MLVLAYTLVPYIAVALIGTVFQPQLGNILNFLSVFALLSIVAFLTVEAYVCRLHDLGRSGWYWLLMLVPVIGFVFFFALVLVNGDAGPNKYGPPTA